MAATKRTVHLICNAHLDPVWQWEWEEGAAEAISTFRVAAELAEKDDHFIFNHNEVTLYKWVQEYEPSLFKQIQRLVKAGKWHIMGGWYLQPDCNMPSGESFVRQILLGKQYFKEHFGVEPRTAINFDPFGHTRGLVQILAKSGYDSYFFGRPQAADGFELPGVDFRWVGYDGSEVMAHRFVGWYNTALGKARKMLEERLALKESQKDTLMLLWGVGNHGGGPSRHDLRDINRMIAERDDVTIKHSTPEAYFKTLAKTRDALLVWKRDLNPWAVGCYTSQIRIKQKHRLLENELYMLEKMAVHASQQGLMPYPKDELHAMACDLMVSEFHDALPGSSIEPVEEATIRGLDHALEFASRLKARAFFSLAAGQKRAKEGEIPILVYNPHPYVVKRVVECEFQLADARWGDDYVQIHVRGDKGRVPSQVEKELGNLPLDWRKRVAFVAELQPGCVNRFDCEQEVVAAKPAPKVKAQNGRIRVKTDDLDVVINTRTGLVDRYRVGGVNCLQAGALTPTVMLDDEDSWGMRQDAFKKVVGRFKLMSRKDAAWFAGVHAATLDAVRVVEDGPVRTVVEALFAYGRSFVCQRYKVPKVGTQMEVEIHVYWNEKDRMLKLAVPTRLAAPKFMGQVAYGVDELPSDGTEAVAQKWVAAVSRKDNRALTIINDGVYASDLQDGQLRLTLLRSPAYTAHPIKDRVVLPQDRYSPRMDQGRRTFRFWFDAGKVAARMKAVDREALVHNEKPMALSFFPPGEGRKAKPLAMVEGDAVQTAVIKQAEKGRDIIVRLFEPTGRKRQIKLSLPVIGKKVKVAMGAFEIKTLRVNPRTKKVTEVNLLERAK